MNKHLVVSDRQAVNWNDAFPVGNGSLGAMVYGGDRTEHLQINEETVWSGGPMDRVNPDAQQYLPIIRQLLQQGNISEAHKLASQSLCSTSPDMRHYEPLGDVYISFITSTKPHTTQRTLDIDEAVVSVTRADNSVTIQSECFATYPDHVIAYRITAQQPISFTTTVSRMDLRNPLAWRCDGMRIVDNATIGLYGTNGGSNGISYELLVRVVADNGVVDRIGATVHTTNTTAATIYITGRTTYRTADPFDWCRQTLNKAADHDYDALRERHIRDYHELYDRSAIHFDDSIKDASLEQLTAKQRLDRLRQESTNTNPDVALWETYLAFGRYLLISSSRPGCLPANLQGIWNQDYEPAWGSKYTININTEMNYWFAERAGLGELQLPLIDLIHTMLPSGRAVARHMYGARGFVAHHNTDMWGDCAMQDAFLPSCAWPLGGAWLCLHIIEHYRYTHDLVFLRQELPVLTECVTFFIDTMIRDKDGYWAVSPSISPEHEYVMRDGTRGALCTGATIDNQILRALFSGYLELAADAVCDDSSDLVNDVRERLHGLRPTSISSDGRIMEWSEEYADGEPGHRHFSPLFALFPGNEIRHDTTPDLIDAAARFVHKRMSNGSGNTGWSKAWVIALYARLWDEQNVWLNMTKLLTDSTLDSLLDNHPPFQIDGNFGAVTAMYETLIQDYGDTIYVLPSLPDPLHSGTLTGMRLICGAVLDMTWRNGHVVALDIASTRAGGVTVVFPDQTQVAITLDADRVSHVVPTHVTTTHVTTTAKEQQ